jgi:hypothetical protein
VEDFIAAAVFVTALAALFVMAVAALKPFLPSKIVEVPAAPGKDAPTVRVYVYNDAGRLYAVEYEEPWGCPAPSPQSSRSTPAATTAPDTRVPP